MKFKELYRKTEEIIVSHKSTHLFLFIELESYNPLLPKSTISATKAE